MNLDFAWQMVKIHLIQHRSWIQTENVLPLYLIQILELQFFLMMGFPLFKCLLSFLLARTIAEEVNNIQERKVEECLFIRLNYSVNFSVVSGGTALIAATSVAGQLAPAIGAAVLGIGGAAGGNMVAQNMCLGKFKL